MFNVAYFGELGSTNDQVKRALRASGKEGYVCRSRIQTGGYGRQGRLWTSPEGGLYQSVLLRPTRELAELPTLGLVLALSIRAAIIRLASIPDEIVQVKWPNDLMVADNKIAGISMERTAGGVCMGMGVNVFKPTDANDLLSDGRYKPAFFADAAIGYADNGGIAFGNGYTFSRKQDAIKVVGDAILSAFAQCYPVWLSNGFAPFKKEFVSCNYLLGKHVRMQLLNGDIIAEGMAAGIGDDGCLLVDDGTRLVAVNSGEAHVLY
jgi:BirA family biotin operon repressor/biotin-[acetyl-CoA-carboxylase] ligase